MILAPSDSSVCGRSSRYAGANPEPETGSRTGNVSGWRSPNDLGSRLRQEERPNPQQGSGATERNSLGPRPGDLATRSRAGSETRELLPSKKRLAGSQRSGTVRQPGAVMAEKPRGPLRLLPKWPKPRGALCGAGRQAGVEGPPWILLSLDAL